MTQPRTVIHRRVDLAKANRNPAVIFRLPTGWAMMNEEQVTPGSCQFLPDPVVQDLNSMDKNLREQFLMDMVIVGDAVMESTDAYTINYEIMGRADEPLHVNIFPRYKNEPENSSKMPAWFYYETEKKLPPRFNPERDKELMMKIANFIKSHL